MPKGKRRAAAKPSPDLEELDDELDEDDEDEPEDEDDELDAKKPAAPDPYLAVQSDLKTLREELAAEREARIRAEERAANARPTRTEPEETLDDDEIDAAMAAGGAKARAVIAKAGRIAARDAVKGVRGELDEMKTLVTGYGMPALANATTAIEGAKLPYYSRYQKLIDERLNQLPVTARTDPNAIRQIHALVAGENIEEIVEERVAAALAKQNGNPGAGPGRVRGRSQASTPGVPTPAELFGEAEARMIASKGGADTWAQKSGFKDWEDLATHAVAAEAEGNA